VPVIVKDLASNEVTGRIADFRAPYHPLKLLVQRLTESKETRHLRAEVHRTIDTIEAQLKLDVSNLQQCHEITQMDALARQAEVLVTGQSLPEPTFTTRQIAQLELYAVRHKDPNERERVLNLINHAEATRHVFTPVKLDQVKTDFPLQTEKETQPPSLTSDPFLTESQRDLFKSDAVRHTPNEPGQSTAPALDHDDLVH
jgi:hypothetical protein